MTKKHYVRRCALAPQTPASNQPQTPRALWSRELRKAFRYAIRQERHEAFREQWGMDNGRAINKMAARCAQSNYNERLADSPSRCISKKEQEVKKLLS